MRLFLLVILILFFISSCSTPKTSVHIYTQGTDREETDRAYEEFSGFGFDISFNDLEIPESINGPTVVYSPLHSSLTDVELILDKLYDMGYEDVNLIEFRKDNHSYTKNNVGVYLHGYLRQHGEGPDIRPFMKEYYGQCPENDMTLNLEKTDGLKLSVYEWQGSSNTEIEHVFHGTWLISENKFLLLDIDGQKLNFSIDKYYEHSKGRNFSVIKLINRSIDNNITNCDFVYRAEIFTDG